MNEKLKLLQNFLKENNLEVQRSNSTLIVKDVSNGSFYVMREQENLTSDTLANINPIGVFDYDYN